MRKLALAALLVSAIGAPVIAQSHRPAKPAKQAGEPEVCKALMSDFEDASKSLALSDAEDVLDDSAIRSTMREAQNSNIINKARMTMDIMKSHGCTLPTFVPSGERYSLSSLGCVTARQSIRAREAVDRFRSQFESYPEPEECETKLWKPDAP